MAWQSSTVTNFFLQTNNTWLYNGSGMTRATYSVAATSSLWYVSTSKSFSSTKNYQFITVVGSFSSTASSVTFPKALEIESTWGTTFSYSENTNYLFDTRPYSNVDWYLNYFSSPNSTITSTDMVEYKATYNSFGNPLSDSDGIPVIKEFKLVELDWFVQGWSLANPTYTSVDNNYAGWSCLGDDFIFISEKSSGTSRRSPLGYSGSSTTPTNGFTASNFIARYVSYPIFNLSFSSTVPSTQSYFDVYLVNNISNLRTNDISVFQQNLTASTTDQFLGRILYDGDYNFYNLTGNKYIVITANNNKVVSPNSVIISNISIDGSYQETDNNEQFLFTNSGTYSEPTDLCLIGGSSDATYSVTVATDTTFHNPTASQFYGPTGSPGFFSNLYGNVVNLSQLNAKVGNGRFKAGIWENGVWNSGWRVDENIYEFDDVEISLLVQTTNTKWRIQIKGPQTSTVNFSVGDKVSIGNIVGIDINESRKLMKNYFTVLSVNDTNIVVEFSNTFPLRRIEKDSENHKIKITKNVWLNGGFFNGYFEGVWNNGLFKGFPYLTEMYNTYWIDGKFDGGHFYGEYPEYRFVDTAYNQSTAPNTLGLTFGATAHGFLIGDLVEIEKDDTSVNPQYDGFATVVEVIDDYMIILDKPFGASTTFGSEGGLIRRRTGTAVIQNFDFYDNNESDKTIIDTSTIQQVYRYNSWIDVRYLEESASNLGRNQVVYESGFGELAQNNLYGHITKDVLSSVSSFRNSYNLSKSIYSLGTKYKIYEDFLGDISEFNEPFGTSITNGGLTNFFNNGWTYSISGMTESQFELTRKSDNESLEIKITDTNSGLFNLENTNVTIEKRRYSKIEFDLLSFEASTDEFVVNYPSLFLLNPIHIPGSSPIQPAFPDQEYVYHTRTEDTKKYEYFYNRRGLDILLLNVDGITASFDNIKFYEVDMVPFFKYTTTDYVNKSVQVPYQGIAPFIDYTDNEFSFIDNIIIGFDSLSTIQTYNPPSSSGGGISVGPIYSASIEREV